MASAAVQLLGFFLGLLGFTGALVATLLPHWRRTAYVGSNIITASGYMAGLWMECVWRSTGIYECELYRSLLALPPDLQVARTLMVLSCVASFLATLTSVMGMKCTRFARGSRKSVLVLCGAVGFFCAGVLCLVTVAWTTNDIVADFYSPFLYSGMKYEIGLAVYLGYAAAFLSLLGGLVLSFSGRGGRSRDPFRRHMGQLSSPPPAFNHVYPSAPPNRDNRAPSLHSISSNGYTLDGYY